MPGVLVELGEFFTDPEKGVVAVLTDGVVDGLELLGLPGAGVGVDFGVQAEFVPVVEEVGVVAVVHVTPFFVRAGGVAFPPVGELAQVGHADLLEMAYSGATHRELKKRKRKILEGVI